MKNRLLFFIFSITFIKTCFAAAPLMHLCLASKYLATHGTKYSPEQKNSFLRGTSFPDIRYLGGISRSKTHDGDATLENIYKTASPFEAGKKFHAWVDEVREQHVEEWKIYDKLKELGKLPQKQSALFLKLIEDAVLFNNTSNKTIDAIMLFSTIDPEEYQYGVSTEKLLRWHAILTIYLSFQTTWTFKISSLLFSNTLNHWADLIPKMAQEKVLINYVGRLLDEFENELKAFKPLPPK